MKKSKSIVLGVVALLVVMAGIYIYPKLTQNEGEKKIEIVIIVEGEKIIEKEVRTNTVNLKELLLELEQKEVIILKYEESNYGMFVTGLGVDKLYEQDANNGIYWMYTSTNNKQCIAAGYCDGADFLNIDDGDSFEFNLSGMSSFDK